ncbi:MAG: hypothetical protein WDM96_03850 [Lacunisphaera sp.]
MIGIFDRAQHALQRHDGFRLQQAVLAQAGCEQRTGELALGLVHLRERQTLARLGNVVPVLAFGTGDLFNNDAALLGVK